MKKYNKERLDEYSALLRLAARGLAKAGASKTGRRQMYNTGKSLTGALAKRAGNTTAQRAGNNNSGPNVDVTRTSDAISNELDRDKEKRGDN